MKRMNKLLSALSCVALLMTLLPALPVAAAVTISLDFEGLAADSAWTLDERFVKSDIPEGSALGRDIKAFGDNEYLLMSIQNSAATTATARNRIRTKEAWGGTYTVEWDTRNDTGVRFETYLRTGGNVRVRQMGRKLYLAVENPAAVAGSMTTVSSKVALQDGKWYTFKAEVSDEKITLTFYDKVNGNTLLDTLVLKMDNSAFADLLKPYNIWFDMWGAAKDNTDLQSVGLDNILITEGTYEGVKSAPLTYDPSDATVVVPTGKAEEKVYLDFEEYDANQRFSDKDRIEGSDISNGGTATRMIRDGGKGKYLQFMTANTTGVVGRIRNRMESVLKFSGSFTVEWDYRNVGDKFARLDTYLRTGGNVRVSVFEDGVPHIRVLDAVKVPSVMESVKGSAPLKGDTWYTFKAVVTDDKLTVEIYDKQTGRLVETMTTAQDGSTNASLYDPYPIWFDMWGHADLGDNTPAAIALDNIRLTSGTYEGLRNSEIAAATVLPPEVSEDANDGSYEYGYDGFGVKPHDNCPSAEYLDVHVNAWYHDAVDYVLTNKLMSGYNAYMFGTRDILTRAMVVQVLYNKEGQPAVSGSHGFTDVPATQWYNNAVTWGTQKGVMSGYGGGKFGPDDAVTIEQIAVILWNYSGNPAPTGNANEVGEHSGWAANGLSWAVASGIFDGLAYQSVTAPASRAQTAQMLMNYLKK